MTRTDYDDELLSDDEDDEDGEYIPPEILDPRSQAFVDDLVEKVILFMHELVGHDLFPYQVAVARRAIESVVVNDGEEITILMSRQSGKSETVADVVAALLVLLPKLALMFPGYVDENGDQRLGKFKNGFWVGIFAPTDDQADTIFSRIVSRLTSEHAMDIMLDPEIDDMPDGRGKIIKLKNSGSFCRMQTAHPRAKIESKSYHLLVVDEAQHADETVVKKCYAAGTPVWLPEGKILPVERVVAERLPVLTYDRPWDVRSARPGRPSVPMDRSPGEIVAATPAEWHDNGVQPVWRVTLGSGKQVEVTANHRWYVRRRTGNRQMREVLTSDLCPGDGVPVPRGVEFWGDWGSEADGYFFGAMLGDGCMTGDYPQWCGHANGSTEAMRAYVEKVGCVVALSATQPSGLLEFRFTARRGGTWNSNPLTALLRKHGVWGKTGAAKSLTRMDYSREFFRGFLAGLIDTDGSVGRKVEITTISETMMRQMLAVLTKFGVYASLTRRKQNGEFGDGENDLWTVSVKGIEALRRLAEEVDLRVERKRVALERLASQVKGSRKLSSVGKRRYSDHLMFDRIVSIEYAGEKPTYCVTVEPSHTVVVDGFICRQSIHPMGAFYNASLVKLGTPDVKKGDFYRAIQLNKRTQTKRGARQNHFEYDWRICARYNPNYRKYVEKEKRRLGEDSDEFRLAYALEWLLERGMFVTSQVMEECSDRTMDIVKAWFKSPVLVGIDPARRIDSTVVTVVWVDWDRPDEFGFYDHRILNWLELHGDEWESQYFKICDFLQYYDVLGIAVDSQGIGDAVAERLARLIPRAEVHALHSTRPALSERWKHLMELVQRRMVMWPGSANARRTKIHRRFMNQMEELEKHYEGPHLLARAPEEAEAHDDYPSSLALACSLTKSMTMPQVEQSIAPFYEERRRRHA